MSDRFQKNQLGSQFAFDFTSPFATFYIMNKLYRSRKDRMFLGICGGLASYWQIDPAAVRLVTVFIWVLTGFIPLLFAYFIAALIIPLSPRGAQDTPHRRLFRSRSDRKIGGVCGGISHLFQIDSTVVRLMAIFLCFITGVFPLLIAYLIAWALIPQR